MANPFQNPVEKTQNDRMKWAGPLRDTFRRLIDGPTQSDPLYLTNRTIGQRARVWAMVAVPVLVIGGLVVYVLNEKFVRKTAPPVEISNAEIAKRSLPGLNQPIKVAVNPDLEVVAAEAQRGSAPSIFGVLKNKSGQKYPYVKLEFELADTRNTTVGAAATVLENVAPHSETKFRFAIPQKDVGLVLVREIRTEKD